MSLSDPCLSTRQLFHDARVVGLQADFVEHVLHNPIREVYETLGKNVPSRELVSFLRGLCKSLYWLEPRNRVLTLSKGKTLGYLKEREPFWVKICAGSST